jgi:hypothetical protein
MTNHNELDILFDNDGTFTIEEANKLLDDNQSVDFDLFKSSYFEKLSNHIKTELDEIKNDANVQVHEPEMTESEGDSQDTDGEEEDGENNDYDDDHINVSLA